MATYVIITLLIVVCIFSVRSYRKKLSSGCCGAGGDAPEKRVKVHDRNKGHYPYAAQLEISGMTCGRCALRVENALNRLDGVWAKVSLEKGRADIRMKTRVDEAALCRAVEQAGYMVEATHQTGGTI